MSTHDAVMALRKALKEDLANAEARLRAASDGVYEKIGQLHKFASEIHLADCVSRLFHVLSLTRNTAPEQFVEKVLCEVTAHSQNRFSFIWKGRVYGLMREELGKHPYHSDVRGERITERREFSAARLVLTADKVDVISLDITIEEGWGEFEPINNQTTTIAWLKPGEWIAEILEWRERYEALTQHELLARKYAPDVVSALKAKYGI